MRKSALAAAITEIVATDPRKLKPGAVVRLLNSTPAGPVLTDRKLRLHRERAAAQIGDGKSIDLLRYAAWLAQEYNRISQETAAGQAAQPPSTREIAAALGLASPADVVKYKRYGMPITSLGAARAWYVANIGTLRSLEETGDSRQESIAQAPSPEPPAPGPHHDNPIGRKLLAQAEKESVHAQRLQLELDVLRGKLVDRAAVKRWIAATFANLRARLESLPDELLVHIPSQSRSGVAADLRDAVRRFLLELADAVRQHDVDVAPRKPARRRR